MERDREGEKQRERKLCRDAPFCVSCMIHAWFVVHCKEHASVCTRADLGVGMCVSVSGIPSLLLYAEDDSTFRPVRKLKERTLQGLLPKLQVKTVERGQHKIIPQYDQIISQFVSAWK